MAKGQISLNTKGYELVKDSNGRHAIRRYTVEEETAVASPSGQQSPERFKSRTFIPFFNHMYGLGRAVVRPSADGKIDPRDMQRIWDSQDVMTQWGTQTTNALLEEDSTNNNSRDEVVRASASFKNNLWTLWEVRRFQASSEEIASRKYNGSTTKYEGGGKVIAGSRTGERCIASDLIAHKTHLLALAKYITSHAIRRSTNGVTWSGATTWPTTNLLSSVSHANADIDSGLLAEIGGEAVAVLYHQTNGTITFFSSPDAGENWADEAVDIPSGNGPQGVAVYQGVDGKMKLYVCTREGLWEVDTSAGTWTCELIFPMTPHTDNGRRMVVHDNWLWFAGGVGDDEAMHMNRMKVEGDRRYFETCATPSGIFLGLCAGDGVPSTMLGPVRYMKSTGDFLFASGGGGAASRNAWIIVHNGLGWHKVRHHGTANQKIAWIDVNPDDDGTQRLHYEIRTSSSVSNTKFLARPLSNPTDDQPYKFEEDGFIDLPEVNINLPHETKAFLRISVDAIDLGTSSQEYINVDYGVDGAARNTTDAGNIVSGTLRLLFASGAGVPGTSIGIRINYFRRSADNTKFPKERGLTIEALVMQADIEGFEQTIDIDETAKRNGISPDEVVANLITAKNLKTLPAFLSPLFSGTKYVKVARPLVFFDRFEAKVSDENIKATRGGTALLVVEEVIA